MKAQEKVNTHLNNGRKIARAVFHEFRLVYVVRVEEEPITSLLSPISPLIPINQPPLGKKTHMASARFGKRAPARHPSIFIYDLKVEAEGDDVALPRGACVWDVSIWRREGAKSRYIKGGLGKLKYQFMNADMGRIMKEIKNLASAIFYMPLISKSDLASHGF